MQIIINAPDNLPKTVIQQQIKEFEEKLQILQHDIKKSLPLDDEFKINQQECLDVLAKIKQGDRSGMTEIGNIDDYIENLKNKIS